jgi:hypothetical protein
VHQRDAVAAVGALALDGEFAAHIQMIVRLKGVKTRGCRPGPERTPGILNISLTSSG